MSTTFLSTFSDQPRYLYQAPRPVAQSTSFNRNGFPQRTMFRCAEDLYDDSTVMEAQEFRLALVKALEPYPEARRAVVLALDAYCPAPADHAQPAPNVAEQ